MMFWNGGGWAFWQVALMWLVMISFWGLLIWGAWALITGASRRQGGQGHGDQPRQGGQRAREILDERLARGEIDPEEYRRLRDVLEGNRPAGAGSGR